MKRALITGGSGAIGAAKAALHGAEKSLSLELACRGITVNTIAPGIIAAERSKEGFDAEMVTHMVPMKRVGQPEEVASLATFLASPESAYITGQVISIHCGMI